MATHTHTTATSCGEPPRTPSRRAWLAGAIALPALAASGISSAATPPHGGEALVPAVATAGSSCQSGNNPDAALIALCAEYMAAVAAYNTSTSILKPEDDSLWHAIGAIEDELEGLESQTLAGVVAKARVARFLAQQQPDGYEQFDTSFTGDWPEQVVRDLLALHGDVA